MLMMRAGSGVSAYDAGWVGGLGVELAQLMHMLLAGRGVLTQTKRS